MTSSALFRGEVVHSRLRPRKHRLRYGVFQLLLDLDELAALDKRLRTFSVGRFNLLSFHERDHLDGGSEPLRERVEAQLQQAGIDLQRGAIRLLCMPRVLGHAFNPLSVFFCHRRDGGLAAILYEVHNTFGERHLYLLPVDDADSQAERVNQTCAKRFFVSPFMPMDLTYRFQVLRPGKHVAVRIEVSDDDGQLLLTSFQGRGEALSDRALLRAWLGAPLLSLKVLGAIHWQALWIWLKGVALQHRQPVANMGVSGPSETAVFEDRPIRQPALQR